jgi:hypothetical protein
MPLKDPKEPFFAFKFGWFTWSCTWGADDDDWYDHDPHSKTKSHEEEHNSLIPQLSPESPPVSRTRKSLNLPEKEWEWEQEGEPLCLMMHAGRTVGRQFAACALIIMAVFNERGDEGGGHLMECNPLHIGNRGALFCEWTKAHVRYFPLLAVLATLLIANRNMLSRRLYYKLLKLNALLDFENFSPLRDPLFWIMARDIANAFAHFIYEIYSYRVTGYDHKLFSGHVDWAEKLGKEEFMNKVIADVKNLAIFYFGPVIVFFSFYKDAHDLEYDLLPINKYYEEDPEQARVCFGHMVYITEETCAAVAHKGLTIHDHDHTSAGFTQQEVLAEVIEKCSKSEDIKPRKKDSMFRLVNAMWPAKILLDPRIKDESTWKFNLLERVFFAFSMLVKGLIVLFFAKQILFDFLDIFSGQFTDMAGQFVAIAHLMLVAHLMRIDWRNYKNYYRKKAKKGFMSDGKVIGASDTLPSQNMGKAWPSMQALQSLHPRHGQSSSQGAGLNLSTS